MGRRTRTLAFRLIPSISRPKTSGLVTSLGLGIVCPKRLYSRADQHNFDTHIEPDAPCLSLHEFGAPLSDPHGGITSARSSGQLAPAHASLTSVIMTPWARALVRSTLRDLSNTAMTVREAAPDRGGQCFHQNPAHNGASSKPPNFASRIHDLLTWHPLRLVWTRYDASVQGIRITGVERTWRACC